VGKKGMSVREKEKEKEMGAEANLFTPPAGEPRGRSLK
jgi:hypothetical protein